MLVNGEVAFSGLEPLSEASAELPAGTVDVSVQAGGADVAGLSADGLALEPGMAYFAYAVGDGDNGYSLLLQTIDTGSSDMPGSVPAGDGSSTSLPYGVLALAGLGVLAIGATAVRVARR